MNKLNPKDYEYLLELDIDSEEFLEGIEELNKAYSIVTVEDYTPQEIADILKINLILVKKMIESESFEENLREGVKEDIDGIFKCLDKEGL